MRYILEYKGENGEQKKWVNRLPSKTDILNLEILFSELRYTIDGEFCFRSGDDHLYISFPYVDHIKHTRKNSDGIPDFDDDYEDYFAAEIRGYLRDELAYFKSPVIGTVRNDKPVIWGAV